MENLESETQKFFIIIKFQKNYQWGLGAQFHFSEATHEEDVKVYISIQLKEIYLFMYLRRR